MGTLRKDRKNHINITTIASPLVLFFQNDSPPFLLINKASRDSIVSPGRG